MAVRMEVQKIDLIDARIDAGFTQAELAEAADLTETTVYLAEKRGEKRRPVRYSTARRIVTALRKRGEERDIPYLMSLEVDHLSWWVQGQD